MKTEDFDRRFHLVNDPTKPTYLGWVQIQADLRLDFHSGLDYKNVYVYLYRGLGNKDCVSTNRLDFTNGTISLGVYYDTSTTKLHFYLDETQNGIYLMIKVGPATDHQNDYQTLTSESYIVDKFQWRVMCRRFDNFARITIQDIIDTMPRMTSKFYTFKSANLTPIVWGQGIKNKVRLVNDANPDGVIICANGSVITPDVFDILDTWSEKDQDLFLIQTFTSVKGRSKEGLQSGF